MPFEFDGDKYKKASGPQKEWGYKLISELGLSGNERILDLGCGDGVLTLALAKLVPNGSAVGVDSSRSMINTAGQNTAPNLSFSLVDINNMNFKQQFDFIFSNAALHWIIDHRQLLAKSKDALVSGGKLVWSFAGAGNCAEFFASIQEIMIKPEYKKLFSDFSWPWCMPTKNEYTLLMQQSGFTHYTISEINADHYFQNIDEITAWIDQPCLVPFISTINNEKIKHSFRQAVIDKTLENSYRDNGTYFQSFRRLQITAEK